MQERKLMALQLLFISVEEKFEQNINFILKKKSSHKKPPLSRLSLTDYCSNWLKVEILIDHISRPLRAGQNTFTLGVDNNRSVNMSGAYKPAALI